MFFVSFVKSGIMRLQSKEVQAIRRVDKEFYGDGVKVYLFGLRLNNEKHC